MQVMVVVKATEFSEGDPPLDPAMMAAMGAFNDELEKAGVLVMARGLRSSSYGRRVAFDGETREVIDGPFTPAGELVAGFWIWNVADLDEATAWVKRCPNPMPVPSVIEIRPFYEIGRPVG
ncbi:YciI family protein [Novosphingobium sp. 9]|uniref:YciI family protein n=1 Tax=Novosphingobium sp. 9 TaxID=2025349 RepID=UPI0021B57E93|nr:YciI family protein [Novosphingobium sp. 9]